MIAVGDGQSDGEKLAYRLSKGLHQSHLTSRDERAHPLPEGPKQCTSCGGGIGAEDVTMWLDDNPYHARCGRAETQRRDAERAARLEQRLRPG